MAIYRWPEDEAIIIGRLREPAVLKICVKTLDEPALIEGWVRHHGDIVGYENLIVADNGSTDPETLRVYEEASSRCTVFRFEGGHNDIHWHPRFDGLFAIIRESCRYFSFIDSDERLVWIDQEGWHADATICKCLEETSVQGIIPATWLINLPNSYTEFSLLDTEATPVFSNNLRWGKPILPSGLVGLQIGIHNSQFSEFPFARRFGTHLFLLHYTQFPVRRIAVNQKKLVSRGIISKDTPPELIAKVVPANHPDPTVLRFVREIQELLAAINGDFTLPGTQVTDYIRLKNDGEVSYSSCSAKIHFTQFLDESDLLISQLFGFGEPLHDDILDAGVLFDLGIKTRSMGKGDQAERIFRRGMALHSTYLDVYGGPAFRKELVRSLLSRGEWARAQELAPRAGDVGGEGWHLVLFARAYSLVGESLMAQRFWRAVLEREPTNGEALHNLRL